MSSWFVLQLLFFTISKPSRTLEFKRSRVELSQLINNSNYKPFLLTIDSISAIFNLLLVSISKKCEHLILIQILSCSEHQCYLMYLCISMSALPLLLKRVQPLTIFQYELISTQKPGMYKKMIFVQKMLHPNIKSKVYTKFNHANMMFNMVNLLLRFISSSKKNMRYLTKLNS